MSEEPGNEQEPVEWNSISTTHEQSEDTRELRNEITQLSAVVSQLSEQMKNVVSQQEVIQMTMQTILVRQAGVEGVVREHGLKVHQASHDVLDNTKRQDERWHDISREMSTNFSEMSSELKKQAKRQMEMQTTLDKLFPRIYLEFENRGRVIIELDLQDCPRASEFFLKIMKREAIKGAKGTVELRYNKEEDDNSNHFFVCNHGFDMETSGDKQKAKDEKSEWGLKCFGDKKETHFWLSWMPTTGYFGRVVEGGNILIRRGEKFVLKDYGVVEEHAKSEFELMLEQMGVTP